MQAHLPLHNEEPNKQIAQLHSILSQIDHIYLIGITYDGKVIKNKNNLYINQVYYDSQNYRVPFDFPCQSPAQTKRYHVGMCDSIAALIAYDCQQVGIPTAAFVTNVIGKPLDVSSHCTIFCQVAAGWIRGDMSFEYQEDLGILKFSPTLKGALDLYTVWCKQELQAKRGIRLYQYDAADPVYWGMDFVTMMSTICRKENLTYIGNNNDRQN